MSMNSHSQNSFWSLIKKGNKSSLIAASGNGVIAAVKFIAALFTGSGAMLASASHTLADTINQGFVYIGSILSEKSPTKRFPTGFGRLINVFCMVAVVVVTVMAFITVEEGIHLMQHPESEHSGFWINIAVLLLNLLVDGSILVKAMKEITHEAKVHTKGLSFIPAAFKNVGKAAPPTRLVFYEDIVACLGALLALTAVLIVTATGSGFFDGLFTTLIGVLMFGVAFKVGYDNMVGLIGVSAPKDVEERIITIVFKDTRVKDIRSLHITQEGRYYHVEGLLDIQVGMSLADADDIMLRIRDNLLKDSSITKVTISIAEDDGVTSWVHQEREHAN